MTKHRITTDQIGLAVTLLKSAQFVDKVALVNNKKEDFFGFIIDEGATPMASVIKFSGFIEKAPDVCLHLNVNMITLSLKSTIKTFDISFDENLVQLTIDDDTVLNFSPIYPDEDEQVDVATVLTNTKLEGATEITLPIDFGDSLKSLLVADAFASGQIEMLNLSETIKYGSGSHMALVRNGVFKGVPNTNVPRSFIHRLASIVKSAGAEGVKLSILGDRVVAHHKELMFVANTYPYTFQSVSAILKAKPLASFKVSGEDVKHLLVELDRLAIPLMGMEEKYVNWTINKGSVNISVKDIGNRVSLVPFKNITEVKSNDELGQMMMHMPSVKAIVKNVGSTILTVKIHETMVQFNYGSTVQLLARYV